MLDAIAQVSVEVIALAYRWGGVLALLVAILLIVWFNVPSCEGTAP